MYIKNLNVFSDVTVTSKKYKQKKFRYYNLKLIKIQ